MAEPEDQAPRFHEFLEPGDKTGGFPKGSNWISYVVYMLFIYVYILYMFHY